MIATRPTRSRTLGARLHWMVSDAWTIAYRDVIHWVREPSEIIGRLLFPVISVLLFGYVFGSAMAVPGGGNYIEFLMPGLFGQAIAFGIAGTAVAMTTDAHRGVLDRFRSMPMARSAVLTGRSIADMLNATLDLVMLVLCGLFIGWRWHGSLMEAIAALGLLLLLRFALIWAGIYLGLIFRTPEAASALLFSLVFPFSMIADAFVSPTLMPAWLGFIAEWNPLSSTISATRTLFGNPGSGGTSWIAQNAMLMAVVWPLVMIVTFVPLSLRRYQRLSR